MLQGHQRRNYFIDPAFQVNFIFKFCLVVVFSSLAIGLAMLFLSQSSTTVAIENTRVVAKPTADFILPGMAFVLLVVAVSSSLVVLVLTLFVSHKISGPIFRMQKEIDLLQGGDLTRQFNIRSSDQLQDLALSLKEMTSALRKKHLVAGGQCHALTNFVEEKNLGASKEDRERLLQMLKELYETLSFFKV
ncbi:MAG: hypothetical protein AB1650_05540 [Candidatus Omnitrophota bacterium]